MWGHKAPLKAKVLSTVVPWRESSRTNKLLLEEKVAKHNYEPKLERWEEKRFAQRMEKWKAKEVDQEERMRILIKMRSVTDWQDMKYLLRGLHGGLFPKALAINDMPEVWRSMAAVRMFEDEKFAVREIITLVQSNKEKYDPDSVFPIVATDKFMETLPEQAQQCNECNESFSEYENVIWKACGKHTIHSHCLRDRLISHEMPLYGPCACNSGYPWEVKPDNEARTLKEKIRYFGFGAYGVMYNEDWLTRENSY